MPKKSYESNFFFLHFLQFLSQAIISEIDKVLWKSTTFLVHSHYHVLSD